jgi:hypothetical protein
MIGDLPAYGSEREFVEFVNTHPYRRIENLFDSDASPDLQWSYRVVEPGEARAGFCETEFHPNAPPDRQYRYRIASTTTGSGDQQD